MCAKGGDDAGFAASAATAAGHDVSDHVKAVLREVVKVEEEKRGPYSNERTGEQGRPR